MHLTLNDNIRKIGLSAKGVKALAALGVKKVKQFLDLPDFREVMYVWGCGVGTYQGLIRSQERLRKIFYMQVSLDNEVKQLRFGIKESKALAALGAKNVKQFLSLDLTRVLRLRGYGAITCKRLRKSQEWLRSVFSEHFPEPILSEKYSTTNTSSENSILDSDPNTRERKSLEILGIKTLEEFLACNLTRVVRLKSYGKGTYFRLLKRQREFQALKPPAPDTLISSWVESPVCGKNLNTLPLFSSFTTVGFTPNQFHPSYSPDTPIIDLELTTRAMNILPKMGIRTLGELLLTPYDTLLRQANFGERTGNYLRRSVREYLLSREKYNLGAP